MTLIVVPREADTNQYDTVKQIEEMLQQICGGAQVSRVTGEVSLVGPAPGDHNEGCDCLRALISSKHNVLIHPLPSPGSEIPATGPPQKKIRSCSGGATVPGSLTDASRTNGGAAGPGTETNVYIDMSNNSKNGYPAPPGTTRRPPLWLILAHELTSGHASHCVAGTLPHPTGNDKVDEAARENQAIESENVHRAARKMEKRKLVRVGASDGG
ncbi:MAG: hypothetical protein ABI853_09910 [Sphingomicrobium sp.]